MVHKKSITHIRLAMRWNLVEAVQYKFRCSYEGKSLSHGCGARSLRTRHMVAQAGKAG